MTIRQPLNLPVEILTDICSLLYDTHAQSLSTFSLVNTTWCRVSTPWIFRHVFLKAREVQLLSKDLESIFKALGRRNAFESVHRITISGAVLLDRDGPAHGPFWDRPSQNSDWPAQYENDYETYLNLMVAFPGSATVDELTPVWQPLVSMIEKTTNLLYLDYNCSNPVPKNLVHALEEFRPACRLHVEHFRYRTLPNGMAAPHELYLAKSPSLHSIKVRYLTRAPDGTNDYNREAVIRSIRGIVPNLKRVDMVRCYPPSTHMQLFRMNVMRPVWQGFDSDIGPDRPAALDHFSCNEHWAPQNLSEFASALNFDNLQHLELKQHATELALHHFTHQVKFRRLDTLMLALSPPPPDNITPAPVFPYSDGASLLGSLEPLKSLDARGFLTENFISTVWSHHGCRLRDLKIKPDLTSYRRSGSLGRSCLSLDEFRRLPSACPLVEHLSIAIQRTKSQGEEVRCYQALSACTNLRQLFIELKCNKPDAITSNSNMIPMGEIALTTDTDSEAESDDEAAEDHTNQPLRYGYYSQLSPNIAHIKRAFKNCAMDETLARSIWKFIVERKQGFPLETLKLVPTGATTFNEVGGPRDPSIEERTKVLSRSFLLQKPARDDASIVNDVQVQELGKVSREAYIRQCRENDNIPRDNSNGQRARAEKAFNRVWPKRKADTIDWRDNWFSIPLDISGISDGQEHT